MKSLNGGRHSQHRSVACRVASVPSFFWMPMLVSVRPMPMPARLRRAPRIATPELCKLLPARMAYICPACVMTLATPLPAGPVRPVTLPVWISLASLTYGLLICVPIRHLMVSVTSSQALTITPFMLTLICTLLPVRTGLVACRMFGPSGPLQDRRNYAPYGSQCRRCPGMWTLTLIWPS